MTPFELALESDLRTEERRFANEWDGSGFDPDFVDSDALRRAWLSPTPVYGAALPLQAAWLLGRDRDRGRVRIDP